MRYGLAFAHAVGAFGSLGGVRGGGSACVRRYDAVLLLYAQKISLLNATQTVDKNFSVDYNKKDIGE